MLATIFFVIAAIAILVVIVAFVQLWKIVY
jgi:hypothetical protein